MGRPIVDKSGLKFGRLFVIRRDGFINKNSAFLCICECGNEVRIPGGRLGEKGTMSCGCYSKDVHSKMLSDRQYKHGLSRTKIYKIYKYMIARCYRKTHKHYVRYGGRGITVCDEWLGQDGFLKFLSDMGEPNDGMTIDRIDNNKGYSKENCRWVSMKEQNNNKNNNVLIEFDGKKQTISQWAEEKNIKYSTLYWRIMKANMNIEDALNNPIYLNKSHPAS